MKRGRKPKCPHCGSSANIAKGFRHTVTLGKRSLRRCKDCKRRFTVGRVTLAQPTVEAAAADLPVAPESDAATVTTPDPSSV